MRSNVKIIIIAALTIITGFVIYSLLHYHHTGIFFPGFTNYEILPLRHWVAFTISLSVFIAILYLLLFRIADVKWFFKSIPQSIKSSFTRKSLITIIPLILAPFTFLLLAPIEMVVRNAIALWFTWIDILPIVLSAFFIGVALLFLVAMILPEKVKRYYVALIWGLGLALYVEGNLLPVDYGILDGTTIAWDEFHVWAVINTIIWGVLLIAPILAVRFWREMSQKAMIYVTCVVVLIQVGTAIHVIAQPSQRRDVELILTDDNLYTVSENKNIIVLVLDSFDTEYMNSILEENPEISDILEGFVFFDNTLAMFPKTRGALSHILTGRPFLNEMPFFDYLDLAFANAPIYPMLYERNFNTSIHTDPLFISPDATLYVKNLHEVEWSIDDSVGMAGSLLNFTGMRYSPHIFKEPLWTNSPRFEKYRDAALGTAFIVGGYEDIHFYNTLIQNGLDVISNRNVFSLIHLMGVHGHAVIDRNVNLVGEWTVPRTDVARGALQIALEYLHHMKELGVDDNTLFIIMADHGSMQLNQRPLLLVRDPSHIAPFSISSAPISLDNIMPMLEAYVAGESTAIDFLHNAALHQYNRTFLFYHSHDMPTVNYLPDLREYIFIDGSNDITNAQFTGIIHESTHIETYYLGETIYITGNQRFFRRGLGHSADEHTLTLGSEMVFSAKIFEPVTSDLELEMRFNVVIGQSQEIRLYANNRFVGDVVFGNIGIDNWHDATFLIPKDFVDDDNILNLRFEFPDAIRPSEVFEGNPDSNLRAIAFKQMVITESDVYPPIIGFVPPTYRLGETMHFAFVEGQGERVHRFFRRGLQHTSEIEYTWTSSYEAVFSAKFEKPIASDLRLDMTLFVFPYDEGQTIRLYAGEQFIEEVFFQNLGWENWQTYSFTIPIEAVDSSNVLTLRFELPDAVRPMDIWEENYDTRLLAIGLREMTISEKT